MTISYSARKAEYAALWAGVTIRPEHKSETMTFARRILQNRPRYDPISRDTGVPWYVVGIIHAMECGLDFSKHLHNGNSLKRRTYEVPAGRPTGHDGPFTFEESAVDALTMPGKAFDKISDWSIERIADVLERYNGMGYRAKGIHSPYLWSFTTHYAGGKYVADHVWSSTAVSQQCGGMAILKALIELEPTHVDVGAPAQAAAAWPKAQPVSAAAVSKISTAAESKSVLALLGMIVTFLVEKLEAVFNLLPAIQTEVDGIMAPLTSLAGHLKMNLGVISSVVVIGAALMVIVRHTNDKHELKQVKGDEQ